MQTLAYGENGAAAIENLEDKFLEIFSKELTRGSEPRLLVSKRNSSVKDLVTAIKLTFYSRSIKNGAGEKDIFRSMFLQLVREIPLVMVDLLPYIVDPATGGSWKDLCKLSEDIHKLEDCNETIISFSCHLVHFYANQLVHDYTKSKEDESYNVSLAAKYAPSEGNHFWNFFGKDIAVRVYILLTGYPPIRNADAYSTYRKMLSFLRKKIGLVDILMCSGNWSSISFETIPSIAMSRLGRYAFPNTVPFTQEQRRSDLEDRIVCAKKFEEYKMSVHRGDSTIHGSTIGVDAYGSAFRNALVERDDNLLDLVNLQFGDLMSKLKSSISSLDGNFDLSHMIPLVDVSGSMVLPVTESSTAMDIAIQMGLILSELNPNSAFYKKVITFHTDPSWVDTSKGEKYSDRYQIIKSSPWGGSTNFEKAFELILDLAIKNEIPSERLKSFKMIVLSDMQFDQAGDIPWLTLHDRLKEKYSRAGYEVPGLIYWNLCARNSNGFVVDDTEPGVIMVSGFGTGQLKEILSGNLKETSPIDKMYAVLNGEVFAPIDETARESLVRSYSLI